MKNRPLNCETHRHMPPLDPAEFERRAAGFCDDVALVCVHLLGDERYPNTRSMAALCDAAEGHVLDLHALNTLVGWVLLHLSNVRHSLADIYGPPTLTDSERDVLAAAWRISDSLHGPRHH